MKDREPQTEERLFDDFATDDIETLKDLTEADSELFIKQQLQNYFRVLFDLELDLSKIPFPRKDGFNTYMAVSPYWNENEIMGVFEKAWVIGIYKYLSPISRKIDRSKEQGRPSGLYICAHRGGNRSDKKHMGKSYNVAKSEDLFFANVKEYLLMTGFHKYVKGCFMDKREWSMMNSFWVDGCLVLGGSWGEAGNGIILDRYSYTTDIGYPGCGLREVALCF